MKKKTTRRLVLSAFLLVLLMGIGYAAVTSTVTITGHVQPTSEQPKLVFKRAQIRPTTDPNSYYWAEDYYSPNAVVKVNNNVLASGSAVNITEQNAASLNVSNLGNNDRVKVAFTVKNIGNVAAKNFKVQFDGGAPTALTTATGSATMVGGYTISAGSENTVSTLAPNGEAVVDVYVEAGYSTLSESGFTLKITSND